ncbi:pilus assembly protein CpaB [Fulvimarina manganoxydans]|uniref:Pilus assembly protein CpaB n=1 Tax=Fulvimarina manganoxydans TaxID=937218 RepID=A0A1W1Z9Y6_9HYPH|nr:Flp pilus assembly protein CpaB [Fulvimarina manganoxydans]MEE2950424.1 Flp pilus assembly protein CpaB [Pseudomonadota bacterium]SMC45195.1 pilus assembly protein CpaB [Fulvimarina manganoxydans]
MNRAQLIVIAAAALAAVGAGFVALNLSTPEPQEPVIITAAPAEPPVKLADVLVASRDLPMGMGVDSALSWQKWPVDGIGDSFIRRSQRPDAIEELKGSIARQAYFAGEPIREAKLIKSESGFLSAVLPSGKRAVSVQIAAATAAGGFILPNDHVDVIMSRRKDDGTTGGQIVTETVLRNLRVLAIDQTIDEADGQRTVIGSTATLEVDADQAEALTAAQQMADRFVLSLRSLADSVPGTPGYAAFLLAEEKAKNNDIRLVRYGKIQDVRVSQ